MELTETAGPDETEGRVAGMREYCRRATEIGREAAAIGGSAAAYGAVDQWTEWVDAAVNAGANVAEVQEARREIADLTELAIRSEVRGQRADEAAWEWFSMLTALAATGAAANRHMDEIEDTDRATDRRRKHALALEMTAANMAAVRSELPDQPPKDVPGNGNQNRRLLNHVRREADATRKRFDESATQRADAIGIKPSDALGRRSDQMGAARRTAITMLERGHAFAIGRVPPPEAGTAVIYWHGQRINAKLALEPYAPEFDASWASVHGLAMLTMATGRTEEQGGLDHETVLSLAEEGLVTMARAERGMHDLNETAIEDLIRLMEQAVGHGEERNAIIDRLAGGQDTLSGWLHRTVGRRRSNVTPRQAEAMLTAGREADVPEPTLEQLADRMGQPIPRHPPAPWDHMKERLASISESPRLALTVERALRNNGV